MATVISINPLSDHNVEDIIAFIGLKVLSPISLPAVKTRNSLFFRETTIEVIQFENNKD